MFSFCFWAMLSQWNSLPLFTPGVLLLVCAPHAAREPASRLTAELALQGSVTVLGGGNCFQFYL